MTQSDDLMLKMIEQLQRSFEAERQASKESRARQYERLDQMAGEIGKIHTSIAVSGKVDAQVRDRLDSMEERIGAIEPVAESWEEMLRAGRRISWFLGISGLLSGAALWAAFQWCGDAIAWGLRKLLRIE